MEIQWRADIKTLSPGFAIVELVIIVTILGMLAAFAIPRFVNFDAGAREAAVQGLADSIRSAGSIDDTGLEVSGFSYDATTGRFTKNNATTPANCSVTYAEAAANSPPNITVDVSGC